MSTSDFQAALALPVSSLGDEMSWIHRRKEMSSLQEAKQSVILPVGTFLPRAIH